MCKRWVREGKYLKIICESKSVQNAQFKQYIAIGNFLLTEYSGGNSRGGEVTSFQEGANANTPTHPRQMKSRYAKAISGKCGQCSWCSETTYNIKCPSGVVTKAKIEGEDGS